MRTTLSNRKARSLSILLPWFGSCAASWAQATAPAIESARLERERIPLGEHHAKPSTCSNGSVVAGLTSGPDLIVGHVFGCEVLGRVGPIGSGTVGMSCYTTACTIGDMATNWLSLPFFVDHPMISVNLFRQWRRDGSDRLEQIGRGWIKHGFSTGNDDECGLGCTDLFGSGDTNKPGCSDTYAAPQFQACDLGPRSMINPYTGVMPLGASFGASGGCSANYPSNDHRDHVHNEISHRVQVADGDLMSSLNVGARYVSEGQYIVPHEFVDGNGTQNNNVAHRRVLVSGPDPCDGFFFVDQGLSFAQSPAIDAWAGASQTLIEPAPLVDGRGFLVQQVTDLGGVWRYDYALYNMNMDRAFGSLSIPLPAGVVVTNVGFKFPPNHAPEPHTENYSNTAWTVSTSGGAVTWSTTPFATDPLANAVRWGSMYNFYFDANSPPVAASATVGLFKTGTTALAATLAPGAGPVDCNNNTIEDRCDVNCGLPGCSVPGCGTKVDCNANFVPDDCEPDCNGNLIADRCDIAASTSTDCDADAVPDECEPFIDCDGNLIRDDCDVYVNPALDADNDGTPDTCEPAATPQTWVVDDDGVNDPLPGSPDVSDPVENGTVQHPFDAIQEGINAAAPGDTVMVLDGIYRGLGNRFLEFQAKPITVRSANGPDSTVVELDDPPFQIPFIDFEAGESRATQVEGFHIIIFRQFGSTSPVGISVSAGSNPTIRRCKFSTGAGNVVGIAVMGYSRPLISHCEFADVQTGITIDESRPEISNCLAYGGTTAVSILTGDGTSACAESTAPAVEGTTITGALFGIDAQAGSFPTVTNSVLWNNNTQISAGSPGDVTVTYSDIQGGWPGVGNINADPLFVSAALDDYRLSAASPAIDAGNNSLVVDGTADFEGGARFFDRAATVDSGVGSAPIVDMGADEWTDCNGNGIDDSIDIDSAFSTDCNNNRTSDSCEPRIDCNLNLVFDACDIAGATSTDCNANTIPDDCDIASATSLDCTVNGVPDECEADCNSNFVADSCDIQDATSPDTNANSVPDECDPIILSWNGDPNSSTRGTRSLTLAATAVTATGGFGSSAIRVAMLDLQNPNPANPPCCPAPNFGAYEFATCTAVGETNGCVRWVGPPLTIQESQENLALGTFLAARLQCTPFYTDWTTLGSFAVFGAEIMPSSTYELTAYAPSCKGAESICTNISAPIQSLTRRSGDVAGAYSPPSASSQPDALDVVAMVNKFRSLIGAPSKRAAQIQPNLPELNADINAIDIVTVVDAFRGLAYPYSGPCPCPSLVICNATACTSAGQCSGGLCVKTCTSGTNTGQPCITSAHCPSGTCGAGFCRDRCGRCN